MGLTRVSGRPHFFAFCSTPRHNVPMNPNKQYGGIKAQKGGLGFENIFQWAGRSQGFHVERMPDGCKTIGKNKIIRIKTPFDFVICKEGRCAFVDTKTINANTFPFNLIKQHQVDCLANIGLHAASGYVVWYRKSDRINFYLAEILITLGSNDSLSHEKGIPLGKISDFRLQPILDYYKVKDYGNVPATLTTRQWHALLD